MNFRRSSGFSLIELMLAMLIGLIIMGGVMQLYISTQDTQRSSEDQLTLLADARFAIDSIAYDLRHTGVWGRHNNSKLIACHSDTTTSLACPGTVMAVATNDCKDLEYVNLNTPLFAIDNSNVFVHPTDTAFNVDYSTCVSDSYRADTDVLSVRYADTNRIATANLVDNVAYVRSSVRSGMVFKATGATIPAAGAGFYKWDDVDASSNHRLVSRTYYVSDYTDATGDSLPSLRRVDLEAGPELVGEVLLPGVEDLQLEFGIDKGTNGVAGTDLDGRVNTYVDASGVTDWTSGEVVSVKIWILMRSGRMDRDKISAAQTFTIAGKSVTTANDGYRRYLVSSVVKMRNIQSLDLM